MYNITDSKSKKDSLYSKRTNTAPERDQYEVLWSRVQQYWTRRICCTLLHKTSYWSSSSVVIVLCLILYFLSYQGERWFIYLPEVSNFLPLLRFFDWILKMYWMLLWGTSYILGDTSFWTLCKHYSKTNIFPFLETVLYYACISLGFLSYLIQHTIQLHITWEVYH
jgi:hypothetical protein